MTNHDPLQPHTHDPNPEPPTADPTFTLQLPNGESMAVEVADLKALPKTAVSDCYIVSTGHGTSGPFTFHGVTLRYFLRHYVSRDDKGNWSQVEVVSADGFGTRVSRDEIARPSPAEPILLAYGIDGRPLTRDQGLVRLIVPSETDDALRQVKWIGRVAVKL